MRSLRLAFPPLIVWMLVGGIFWLLQSQSSVPEQKRNIVAVSEIEQKTKEPLQTAFVLPRAQSYGDQLSLAAERPLFSETRRIPEPEKIAEHEPVFEEEIVIEEPPAPPEPPALVFKGFVRNGEEMQALLGLAESPEEQWVSKGDVLLEWQVRDVSESSVRLERDGFEHVVEISQ